MDTQQEVASFTDAWIETLKAAPVKETLSVASFTDAWIETKGNTIDVFTFPVASFTDAWIETKYFHLQLIYMMSHLLQMRGLKLE